MSLPESAGREGAQGGAGSENSNHQSRDKVRGFCRKTSFSTSGRQIQRAILCTVAYTVRVNPYHVTTNQGRI
jgi:hypothetical protein